MKYRIGDEVLVKSDLKSNRFYGCFYVSEAMAKFAGTKLAIIDIRRINNEVDTYIMDTNTYWWCDYMIECLVNKYKVELL